MLEIFDKGNVILEYIFYVYFMLLFYLSIKRCFWREGKSKRILFVLTLISNPLALYMLMFFLSLILSTVVLLVVAPDNYVDLASTNAFLIGISLIGWGFFFCIMFLDAYLIGKWLKAYNKSLVVYVYLMFSVLMICTYRSAEALKDTPLLYEIFRFSDTVLSYVAATLLYHYAIKALAKMTDRVRRISWKVFVYPPLVFSLVHVVFSTFFILFEKQNLEAVIIFYMFSFVLYFLFIWSFYVIIQNINSVNQTKVAKEEIKKLSVEVMEALAHTIDAKDEYTRGHSVRVARYSQMLAQRMGLSRENCESVYYMGLLHDIGKIGVPNEIINSKEKLTDEEYTVIKKHPGLGYEILAEIKSRPDLSIGARWHHERYDGKGYPDGKAGEDIPLFARIIAVADSYDAMTSNRSYRNYLSQEAVRNEIQKNAGVQFDPKVAEKMMEIIDEDKNFELHE